MSSSEGYVKFRCDWIKDEIHIPPPYFEVIQRWRKTLFDLHLIGALPNGIGFGNISIRSNQSIQFFISGSATGHIAELSENEYARVISYDIENNSLQCIGQTKASSESLSHGAIYQSCPAVNAAIHIHSESLWNRYLNVYPTTLQETTYGTPEMAYEIIRIAQLPGKQHQGIIIMGGHTDGIIAYGQTMNEAGTILLEIINQR